MTNPPPWGGPDEPPTGGYGQQPPPPGYGPQPGGLPSYGQYGQPTGPGGWQPTAPAPGGVPLRPLAFGDLLSGPFTLIRQNPGGTIGLIALGVVIAAVIEAVMFGIAAATSHPGLVLIAYIPAILIDAVVAGGAIASMGGAFLGRKIGIGDAISRSRLGWVLLTGVIFFLIFFVPAAVFVAALHGFGFLLTLVLYLWIGVMLSLTLPVVVLERKSPFTAIGRSWRLVTGSYWRIFGIFALLGVIFFVLYLVFALIIGLVGVAGISAGLGSSNGSGTVAAGTVIVLVIVSLIFGFVIGTLITAIGTGVITLLYADMRMRKEGLDLVLQQAAQAQRLTGDEFAMAAPGGGPYPGS
jgi:hypothetical protein